MKRLLFCALMACMGLTYAVVVLWLIFTEHPGHMMAGAFLIWAPFAIAARNALHSASVERKAITRDLEALKEKVDALFR